VRKQVRTTAEKAADAIVAPLTKAGAPKTVTDPIHEAIENKILDQFLAQAVKQCKAPSLADMIAYGQTQLQGVIDALPANLGKILNDAVSDLNGVIGGITSSPPTALPTGIPGVGGGGLLPRAQLGEGYQRPQPIDPFGLAAKGYDPGVGTMLFEGVATQR
jgi:hypothetical protein